jgi:AcrR family transcriptional regulator
MAKETDRGTKRARPRTPLQRGRIIATAVEIADEHGIEAVTMRAVASRLGVEAMSLYNHVANKDEILDGMMDLVADEFSLPHDAAGWRDAMRRRAVSARQVFARHPWAPALLDSRVSSGPSRLRYFDWVLGTLVGAGFPLDAAARAFSLLDSYVYGFGKRQANASTHDARTPEQLAGAFRVSVPAETYPYLYRMASRAMDVRYDADADFDFGLDLILDGLQRVLDAGRPD